MGNRKNNILKALVIDDNEVNTIVLANMLELFDINADQSNSGIQALSKLVEMEYDIVFVDHVMPKMDGIQTTKAIRDVSANSKSIVIIALTSSITDEIRRLYHNVGANAVYAKPIGLLELASILIQWCPQLSIEDVSNMEFATSSREDDTLVKVIIEEISEINYSIGIKYAIGDPKHYINILGVAMKDINNCLNTVMIGYENNNLEDMRIGVHNVKSVFTNIGATELAELAKDLEQVTIKRDADEMENQYTYYVKRIINFYEKLETALKKYDDIAKVLIKEHEDIYLPLTKKEYEQSINNTIYYIKRYDYSAILVELELLSKRGKPEYKIEFELALNEIKDYNYENSLMRINNIKKEMDKCPISLEMD